MLELRHFLNDAGAENVVALFGEGRLVDDVRDEAIAKQLGGVSPRILAIA